MNLPLIITGMHRSGTSLTASLIKAIGVDIGNSFFAADHFNIKGYFEDLDFLEFQRSVLKDCCPVGEAGWPDWGWTEGENLDRSKFQDYVETAKELIDSRDQKSALWGWKDPRTSLMLDFWHELLPEARYLFVYRFPWDVADSIQRLKAAVFSEHPDYALRIWAYYNRQLLQFYQQHSERCVLLNVNALLKQPELLIDLLKNKLNLPLKQDGDRAEFKHIYEQNLFKSLDWNHPSIKSLYQADLHYFSLLEELDRAADLPSEFSVKEYEANVLASRRLAAATSSLSLSSQVTVAERFELDLTGEFERSREKIKSISQEMPQKNGSKNEVVVSVVIPCFNQGEFILEAISSIESCQDRVYEILIVDDASTEDLTQRVLKYLKSKGYFVIEHSNNQGLAEARNTGIEKARGKYILPLDSDNKIRPEYITKSIEILDEFPEVGVVYGNAKFFGERTDIWEIPEFDINKIVMRNYIDACAVFRKKVWEDCGGYDSKIPDKLGYEDWDFWLGAAEHGWKFYHIPEVLFDYRVRTDSMVSLCRIPENHEKLVRYISTKHLKLFTANFANILAQKDSALLGEQMRSENLHLELEETQETLTEFQEKLQESEEQLQETQAAWEQSQEHLKQYQTAWGQTQEELQRIQTAWDQAQEELRSTYINWVESQSQQQHIQIAWGQVQKELQETYAAWENSQQQLQQIQTNWMQSQEQQQRIQGAWEQAQEELRNTYAAWAQSHEQQQRIQTAWEQAQKELESTYAAWAQSQEQQQRIQAAWEQAQKELQNTYAAWESSQQQLQQTQAAWRQSQEELQRIQAAWEEAQEQIQKVYGAWEHSQQQQQRLQADLEQSHLQMQHTQVEWERSQAQLEQSQAIIRAMESSKFWQFRTAWVRLKRTLGLARHD